MRYSANIGNPYEEAESDAPGDTRCPLCSFIGLPRHTTRASNLHRALRPQHMSNCPDPMRNPIVANILYLPLSPNTTNKYCENMVDVLSQFGPVSGFTVAKGVKRLFSGDVIRADVIFLNWVENEIVSTSGALSIPGFMKSLIKILLCKFFAKKLVYVRHNRYPHKTSVKHRKSVTRAADFLESCCDASIVHSMMARTGTRFYVPHPLYKLEARSGAAASADDGYFVCFGRILRYKNFETLIKSFPADRKLLIVGACDDAAYLAELNALATDNVTIRGEYIDEKEAQQLVSDSEGVIICHAEDDVIASGTFFYSISLGVKVYALETDFTTWAHKELGDGLVEVHRDIPALARGLPSMPRAKGEVDPRVQALFGPQAVRQAVSEVLARIGMPAAGIDERNADSRAV
jgi:hypothetical protein